MRVIFRRNYLPRMNHLTLLDVLPRNRDYRRMCKLRCHCGREIVTQLRYYAASHTKSCGRCAKKGKANHRKHGHRPRKGKSPTYITWCAILDRCGNTKFPAYLNVRVCERWSDKKTGFQNFLQDVGERPANTTLGRHLDLGDYEVGNVSWQTPEQQAAEKKKKRKLIREILKQFARQNTQRPGKARKKEI